MKEFNEDVYGLAISNGSIGKDFSFIHFTIPEFEQFMADFVGYVQKRQMNIVKEAERRCTYMGEDVPAWIMINEVKNSIYRK